MVHGLKFPTWTLPESGMEPVSPLLTGGFFTTEPPRKPGVINGNRILKAIRVSSVQAEFMNSSRVSLGIKAGNGGDIVIILTRY